tara:strand:- start:171 stop:740 length:570 start_codon:yes stop_codon:yes gene_type:complete
MGDSMKIYKLYSNVLELKRATHDSACFDIHAHLRGPVPPEDKVPIIRTVKWYDCYNQLHETTPSVVFESDIPICTFELGPKCRALIPTGMIMDIPNGCSGRIHPRSGNAWKNGVTLINCEGVIDSDYCNEVFVPLYNTTNIPFKIVHGDRISQIEIIKPYSKIDYIIYTEAKAKENKTNRKGGFGSTGV